MLTRQRDLDAFAHGSEADVWLCEDEGGLAFALIGTRPDRRVPLPAIYGGLTLQNGVPIGYHQADLLGRSAAVSFNTFETFRGGESAHTFARLLATLHAFCGATSFSIEPYQLGQGNDEGIDSGAWWFYFKLGFRPRARAAMQMAAVELDRVRKRPSHRTTPETLRKLAEHHVFLDLEPKRPAPLLLPSRIGLRVGAFLSLPRTRRPCRRDGTRDWKWPGSAAAWRRGIATRTMSVRHGQASRRCSRRFRCVAGQPRTAPHSFHSHSPRVHSPNAPMQGSSAPTGSWKRCWRNGVLQDKELPDSGGVMTPVMRQRLQPFGVILPAND